VASSVFAAGFHNVIASSGTAFTELQARLLSRFTRNVVVNFDPDTAGAKATERTLGLLVEEEFQVRVLTLEPGFDPDLFIRRKGKGAYAEALKKSQRYFDYLIERAQVQFPVRSAEGKVKALNYLLPHMQRVPSRIVRDELIADFLIAINIRDVGPSHDRDFRFGKMLTHGAQRRKRHDGIPDPVGRAYENLHAAAPAPAASV